MTKLRLLTWLGDLDNKFKFFLLRKSKDPGYYIGWIGYRGMALEFHTGINLGSYSEFKEVAAPFKERRMIVEIFEKQWVNK